MRIFNAIRKLQLERHKIWNYLVYALGEVVLIVIGLLIAVQVNNWNQARKDDREATTALRATAQSFCLGRARIDAAQTDYRDALEINELRIRLSGPNARLTDEGLADQIGRIALVGLDLPDESRLGLSGAYAATGASDSLRDRLFDYATALDRYRSVESNAAALTMRLREGHQRYATLLTMTHLDSTLSLTGNNLFPSDYDAWLRDRDSQNTAVEYHVKLSEAAARLGDLATANDRVLDQIRSELRTHRPGPLDFDCESATASPADGDVRGAR